MKRAKILSAKQEKVSNVKQAVSYIFGTPIKLPVEINDESSNQAAPSVVDNGSNWVLYYISDHAGGIKQTDPYRAVINKNILAVQAGPADVADLQIMIFRMKTLNYVTVTLTKHQ